MGLAASAQGNVAHDTEYCILDNKFRDLVTERQGFDWVDEAKPDSYVRLLPRALEHFDARS